MLRQNRSTPIGNLEEIVFPAAAKEQDGTPLVFPIARVRGVWADGFAGALRSRGNAGREFSEGSPGIFRNRGNSAGDSSGDSSGDGQPEQEDQWSACTRCSS